MSARVRLVRVALRPEATLGVLLDEGMPFALTLERPWENNRPSVGDVPGSCIPAGTYRCARVNSPRFGNTFEVTGVPGRSHILFHKGNLAEDTYGCILVGEMFEPVSGTAPAIQASAQGFGEFLRRLQGVETFTLEIVEVQ